MHQKGFTAILFLLLIFVLSVGIVGGSFYLKNQGIVITTSIPKGINSSPTPNNPKTYPLVTSLNNKPTVSFKTSTTSTTLTPSPTISSKYIITSDKKTYVAKDGSFSFLYPGNWAISEDTIQNGNLPNSNKTYQGTNILFARLPQSDWHTVLGIQILKNKDFDNMSLEEFLKNMGFQQSTETTIGPFNVREVAVEVYGKRTVFVFSHNDTFYIVQDQNYNDVNTVKEVISTFKFTN